MYTYNNNQNSNRGSEAGAARAQVPLLHGLCGRVDRASSSATA